VTDDPAEDLGEVVFGLIGPFAAIALSITTTIFLLDSYQ
jgi:hypothetical protein